MIVGFLNNQIDNRGTGNAVFDYAHYNEEILGNESKIFTFSTGNHDPVSVDRFVDRFKFIYQIDTYKESVKPLDVLYHIKSGEDDGFRPPEGIRYAVHGVFHYSPHGDRYAAISRWLCGEYGVFVPHIVSLPKTTEDYRSELGISRTGCVFGRHGGFDTFDILFAWNAIRYILTDRLDTYFFFLNTDVPDDLKNHPRIKILPNTANSYEKAKFINTCDAMIHARSRGETFGISVGEFAIMNKPVITYSESQEKAHLEELGNFSYIYKDEKELIQQMESLILYPTQGGGYGQYTPENVMKKFNEVFLS